MDNSPLIYHSLILTVCCKRGQGKRLITNSKQWNLSKLNKYSLKEMFTKIKDIPIQLANIDDKLILEIDYQWRSFLKRIIMGKTITKSLYLKAKLLNAIWHLNLFPRGKLFDCKLILKTAHREVVLESQEVILGDCSFCNQAEKNIPYSQRMQCDKINLRYHRYLFPFSQKISYPKRFLILSWTVLNKRNNIIFRNYKCHPTNSRFEGAD